MNSPQTIQPGPDEEFYFRFGEAVASGQGQSQVEFAFMDPAYGYLIGSVFKLFGPGLYLIYLLQVLLDTATAYGLNRIGRAFSRPRAGLLAALLYGLTSTAIMFTATMLKATWVANFMVLWVLCALWVLRSGKLHCWLAMGLLCGYGVALRSNLALLTGLAIFLLPWLGHTVSKHPMSKMYFTLGMFIVGLALPLLLLAARNEHLSKVFSPIPNNGGVVLHQVYNLENPRADIAVPSFVKFAQPSQIWRDYSKAAERQVGHRLTPHEIDRFWRGRAIGYILGHPREVASNCMRKLGEFISYVEVPNNRSIVQERLFSPVLNILPRPFGWLFAFGAPGIFFLLKQDRRAWLLIAPIAVTMATVAVFFSEDRFRFHAVPMVALGAGMFLDYLWRKLELRQAASIMLGLLIAGLLGGLSLLSASRMSQPPVTWERVAWGYLKMGQVTRAQLLASKVAAEEPMNSRMQEILGYIAVTQLRNKDAVRFYRNAVAINPNSDIAHYNLAKLLSKSGELDEAYAQAILAVKIAALPDYIALQQALALQRQARGTGYKQSESPDRSHKDAPEFTTQ